MIRRSSLGAILAVAVGAALALASGADSMQESYPGKNGLIAYVKREPPCIGSQCAETIWVSALDGSKAKRLTSNATKNSSVRQPVWSPDGRRLAYIDFRSRELWVVNANGSGRKLVSKALGRYVWYWDRPSWTPDSREVVVRLVYENLNPVNALWAVDVRTSKWRKVVSLPGKATGALLSPNGKLVAFIDWVPATYVSGGVSFKTTEQTLFVMGVNGKGKRPLAVVSNGWHDNFGDWSPDSKRLVVLANSLERPRQTSEFLIVNVAGGEPRRLIDIPEGIQCYGHERRGCTWEPPIWSPDGKTILSQVDQYGEDNPDYGKIANAPRSHSVFAWDRFITVSASSGAYSVAGPGVGSCQIKGADPEVERYNYSPCRVFSPSWQPRR